MTLFITSGILHAPAKLCVKCQHPAQIVFTMATVAAMFILSTIKEFI